MSTSSKGRPRRSARGGRPVAGTELTSLDIAAATLAVIADGGVESLTRQRVADALGVSVRALYRLTPSVDHLLAGAVAQWQRQWRPPPDTGDYREDLRQWCIDSRRHAAAYPGLTFAAQRLPPALHEDASGPVMTAVLARLARAGFDESTAGQLFGVLSMHALGWAVVFPDAHEVPEASGVGAEQHLQHLRFREQGFELGLNLLLNGIEALARRGG